MEHKHHGNHHNPAPGEDQKEFFNGVADRWDDMSEHDGKKIRYIISLLKLKGDEKILDVGTGTGVMIPFYEETLKSGSVIAVDFSEGMIKKCREKFPSSEHPSITFDVADVYDLTYNNEFNVVMSYSCFPHFTDHQRAIDIFAKALRRGGRFAIAHSSSRDHINHIHSHSSSHIQDDVLPSLEEFRPMFKKAGLHITFERSDDEYHIIIGKRPWL